MQAVINSLKRELKAIEKRLDQAITDAPQWQDTFRIVLTVPGGADSWLILLWRSFLSWVNSPQSKSRPWWVSLQ
jgi:hypothetical protein